MTRAAPQASRPVVHLLRHGETGWNALRRMQGHADAPLNDVGRAQAVASAERLAAASLARIVSSDLTRARDTALAVARVTSLEVALDGRLREQALGEWQGLTFAEARARDPEVAERFAARDPAARPPGGETRAEMQARAWEALEAWAAPGVPGPILLVTHGGVIQALVYRALGLALDVPRRFLLPNAGLSTLVERRGVWYVRALSDTAHLPFADDDSFPFE
jgi:broad specificity phosphatase PhoE